MSCGEFRGQMNSHARPDLQPLITLDGKELGVGATLRIFWVVSL